MRPWRSRLHAAFGGACDDASHADGDVLGSVSGTSSPLTLTVKLSGTGAQDIGGSAHLTGVFADFAGTVKVALT